MQSTERYLKCQVSLLLLSSSCYLQHVNIPTVIYSKYSFAFALNNHLTRLLLYTPSSLLPPLAIYSRLSTLVLCMHLVLAAVSSPPWHNLHAVRQRARTHIKNAHATRGVAFVVVVVATMLVVVAAVALCTEQSCCRILTQFLLPAGQTSDSRTSVEILWPHSCTCLDTEASLNYKLCACERERQR